MKKIILIAAAYIMTAICAQAQTGIASGTRWGIGADSARCSENVSLFYSYGKSKNFEDAYPFWRKAYDECPASSPNIYLMGVDIINWQLSNETDPAKREELINAMMKLFDDRVKYFGNNPRYPKDNTIARKAITYNELKGENTDYALMYKWLGEVIDEFKEKTDLMAVSRYIFASFKIFQGDPEKYKTQYLDDFLKCANIFDAQNKDAVVANNTEVINSIAGYKTVMEQTFFASGIAECPIIIDMYSPRVEANKNNLDYLKETMTLLRRLGCNETDLFITASEYVYKIQPTAESAMGLGSKALKNNDVSTAEKYFNEAIAMSDDPNIKATLYYSLASLAQRQNQFQRVKQLFQNCIRENPNHGKVYMVLASAYAAGGKNLSDDSVLAKCIYYAVVEKLEKAKQLDPSLTQECNKLINDYSKGFPSKEDIFLHPALQGGTYTIGGWVNETVKIR